MEKKIYCTIDTETYGTIEYPIAFDIGGIVHDAKGNELERFSFCIFDAYVQHNNEVQKAFYASKLPQYDTELLSGKRKLITAITLKKFLEELVKKYHIEAFLAYNAHFDYRALRNMWRLNGSRHKKIGGFWDNLPPLYCTMKWSNSVIHNRPMYSVYCKNRNFLTKTGRISRSAEVTYRYCAQDDTFVEEHIGIYDCEIEKDIFVFLKRAHKKLELKDYNKKEF